MSRLTLKVRWLACTFHGSLYGCAFVSDCGSCVLLGLGLLGIGEGIRWLSYRGKGTIKLMLTDLNLRACVPTT